MTLNITLHQRRLHSRANMGQCRWLIFAKEKTDEDLYPLCENVCLRIFLVFGEVICQWAHAKTCIIHLYTHADSRGKKRSGLLSKNSSGASRRTFTLSGYAYDITFPSLQPLVLNLRAASHTLAPDPQQKRAFYVLLSAADWFLGPVHSHHNLFLIAQLNFIMQPNLLILCTNDSVDLQNFCVSPGCVIFIMTSLESRSALIKNTIISDNVYVFSCNTTSCFNRLQIDYKLFNEVSGYRAF